MLSVSTVNLFLVVRNLLICERSDMLEILDEIFVIKVVARVIANMRCPDSLLDSVLASNFHL